MYLIAKRLPPSQPGVNRYVTSGIMCEPNSTTTTTTTIIIIIIIIIIICKQHEETIDHLISGFPILAKNEYLMRHDIVGAHLHYSIHWASKKQKSGARTHAHTHNTNPVCKHENVTVSWNQDVNTDTEVMAKRIDIIIKNRKEKTYTLIDVAIPANRNVIQKEAEKKLNTTIYV